MATTRTHHRKISRKELKQPDEFFTFLEQSRDFIFDNLTQVITSAAIVLAASLIAFGIYTYERHRDDVAGDRFYSAMAQLNQKNYREAESDFGKLAEDEPGRRVGQLSRFYLASAYLEDGKPDKARDALIAFLASSHDPTFTNLALDELGVTYEKLGDYKKAEGAYSQAASVDGPMQAQAQLGLARMMLKQGNKTGAIKIYQQYLQEHPFTQERATVAEALAQLGAPASPPAPATFALPKAAPPAAPASVPH